MLASYQEKHIRSIVPTISHMEITKPNVRVTSMKKSFIPLLNLQNGSTKLYNDPNWQNDMPNSIRHSKILSLHYKHTRIVLLRITNI